MTGVEIRHIQKVLAIRHADCDAFVNRARGTPIHCLKRMRAIEIRIPARNHSIFADEDKFCGKRACAVTHLERRTVIPDDTGRISALGVGRTTWNRDNESIRETWRGRAILKIFGGSSSAVVGDEYCP